MIQLIFFLFVTLSWGESSFTCETTYDKIDIPHVKTKSMDEYYYCFGLHHGRDRAWSMDYFRRLADGRNAEIYGFSSLKSDLMMRLLDLRSLADKIWMEFPEEQKRFLDLYSKGANAGFETGKNAFEFKDLGYEPEIWKPTDTILVLLLQSFDQTRKTFSRDLDEEKSKEVWGSKAEELFNEDGLPWENTILKDGEYEKSALANSTYSSPQSIKLWSDFPTAFGDVTGSNNWVVSKEKSKSGKAMLANDPHLDLKTPLFWYWINIETTHGKVMGGSVPGVPVIPSGTNGKISWGLTNSYNNSADAILIENLSEDLLVNFRPTVMVKFLFFKIPFFFKSFEKLSSGHRVLPLDIKRDEKVILRWSGFSLKAQDIIPMFNLYEVSNVTEMNKLLMDIGLPSWNFVFADRNGDIGYRMVGKTYEHTHKTKFGLSSMSYEEINNEKFLAPDNRPHILKPKRNYVHTANHRHWPEDSKYYGGRGYSDSFRGFRIDELLGGQQNVESFKNIQCDQEVVDARFFLTKLKKYLNLSKFSEWSATATDSSYELPLYRRLMDLLIEKWTVNEYSLYRLLDHLPDDKTQELKQIFAQAEREVAGRNWGEIHRLKFPHLSKYSSWKFSPEIPGLGDTHSVNPGTSKWNSDLKVYEQTSGASMRMIIEMDKVPQIWLSLPGKNRHYQNSNDVETNPWKNWKNCEYTKVDF